LFILKEAGLGVMQSHSPNTEKITDSGIFYESRQLCSNNREYCEDWWLFGSWSSMVEHILATQARKELWVQFWLFIFSPHNIRHVFKRRKNILQLHFSHALGNQH